MENNLHTFPLPEQEAAKLNEVTEVANPRSSGAMQQRMQGMQQRVQGMQRRAVSSMRSKPWPWVGVAAALAACTGAYFWRQRA